MPLIRLNNVSRYYKIDKEKFYALRNFTYDFPNKGLISICGKSGSGKSTLLNIIGLLDKPNEGLFDFNNEDTRFWKEKRINRYRNKEIGIVFQKYNLLEEETALYNIYFPMLINGQSVKKSKEKAYTYALKFGFNKEFLNKKVKQLSGGEKQRIAILRSIINDPKMLLCDEPTGALDQMNSIIVMDLLKEISKKILVIMVSHNMDVVKKYSDEVIALKDGISMEGNK